MDNDILVETVWISLYANAHRKDRNLSPLLQAKGKNSRANWDFFSW